MAEFRVFVSGKEGELADERAMANDVISSIGLKPVGSESRDASDRPVEMEFIEEVRTSDIYVGILGAAYSGPTIKEFEAARAAGLSILLFVKEMGDEERHERLMDFIKKVRDPQSGITTSNFKNVVEFRDKLKRAIIQLLTRNFKNLKEVQQNLKEQLANQLENVAKRVDRIEQSVEMESLKKELGIVRDPEFESFIIPSPVIEGRATFLSLEFPKTLEKTKLAKIKTVVRATVKNGFMDLMLRSPKGADFWIPDPTSWDAALDTGKINVTEEVIESQWDVALPESAESGSYILFVALYEDFPLNPKDRHALTYRLQKVKVQ